MPVLQEEAGTVCVQEMPFCSDEHEAAFNGQQAGIALKRVLDPMFTEPVQKAPLQPSKPVTPRAATPGPAAPPPEERLSLAAPPALAPRPAPPPVAPPIARSRPDPAPEPEAATFRPIVAPPGCRAFLPQAMPLPRPSEPAPAPTPFGFALSAAPQLPERLCALIDDKNVEPETEPRKPAEPAVAPETPQSHTLYPALEQQKPEGVENQPQPIEFPGSVLPVKFQTAPYAALADALTLDVERRPEAEPDPAPAGLLWVPALRPQPVDEPAGPARNLESALDSPPLALRYPFADLALAEDGTPYRMPDAQPASSAAPLRSPAPNDSAWPDRAPSLLDPTPVELRYPWADLVPAQAAVAHRMPGESSAAPLRSPAPNDSAWPDRAPSLLDPTPVELRYPLADLAPAQAAVAHRMPGASSAAPLRSPAPNDSAWPDRAPSLLDSTPVELLYPFADLSPAQADAGQRTPEALLEPAALPWTPATPESWLPDHPVWLGVPQSFTTPPPVPRPDIAMGASRLGLASGSNSDRAVLEPRGASVPHMRWKVLTGLREAPAKLRVPRFVSRERQAGLSTGPRRTGFWVSPSQVPATSAPPSSGLETWTSEVTLPVWQAATLAPKLPRAVRTQEPSWALAQVTADPLAPEEARSFDPVRSPGLPAGKELGVATAGWFAMPRDIQPDRRHKYRPSSLVADLNGFQRVRAASFIQIREPELRRPSPGDFRGASPRLRWSGIRPDGEPRAMGTPVPLRPAVRTPEWAA